jgi:hypothetical protein
MANDDSCSSAIDELTTRDADWPLTETLPPALPMTSAIVPFDSSNYWQGYPSSDGLTGNAFAPFFGSSLNPYLQSVVDGLALLDTYEYQWREIHFDKKPVRRAQVRFGRRGCAKANL